MRSPIGVCARKISIHALLAESDVIGGEVLIGFTDISIHALLAESDAVLIAFGFSIHYFYPRSPCGERLNIRVYLYFNGQISIHALLAESDPQTPEPCPALDDFYPRSPCGERPPLHMPCSGAD